MLARSPTALFMLLLLSIVATTSGCTTPTPGVRPARALVIGHRGAPYEAPENTLPAMDAAVRLGANGLEVDLSVTADGAVVLWHDTDPDLIEAVMRQIGAEGYPYTPSVPSIFSRWRQPVDRLTLAQLREHYGYEPGRWHIPTLEEFFDWLQAHPQVEAIYLDVKDSVQAEHVVRRVWEALDRGAGLPELKVFLMHMDPQAVRRMRATAEELGAEDRLRIQRDLVGDPVEAAITEAGTRHVSMGARAYELWTSFLQDVAEAIYARDQDTLESVIVWTYDEEDQQRELLTLGVDGLITDRPGQLRRIVDELAPDPDAQAPGEP